MVRDFVVDINKIVHVGDDWLSSNLKSSVAEVRVPSGGIRREDLVKMEARMEAYKLHHMDLNIEDLLAFPIQVADAIRKGVEETDSFREECAGLNKKVERLVQYLRQAARFSTANAGGLYERPTRRIMLEVLKALERALGLVKKCKRSGILRRVMTITTTADFKKVNHLLEGSIGDVRWLLNISSSGDDRSEYAGLPPIASTDPVLALVWEQISIVHVGTPEERADAAAYLGTLAKDNERNVKIIIEEGGVAPLLRLLKEGLVVGQESAARALGLLARDSQRVQEMRKEGASSAFIHILGSPQASMKVQTQVAWAISRFAMQNEEAQSELASHGAIRLLVGLLAHDIIVDETAGASKPPRTSIHSIVKSNMLQLRAAGSRRSYSVDDSGNFLIDTDTVDPLTLKPGSTSAVLTHLKSTAQGLNRPGTSQPGVKLNAPSRTISRPSSRDREDPELRSELQVQVGYALWHLAAGNIKNSRLITDTCALLCFAKLMETGQGQVKSNAIMTVMEIAASAERDSDLRRAAFKTNSPSAKAVVERLLAVIKDEDEDPDLQVPCLKAIGSLAHIFPAPAKPQLSALVGALTNLDFRVATEAAAALSKFASDDNYLHMEHSKNIIAEGAAEHLVQLVVNFGDSDSQLAALELLCYLSLNCADSEALAKSSALQALETILRSQLLLKHETAKPLVGEAIAKLELYQLGSFSLHNRKESRLLIDDGID